MNHIIIRKETVVNDENESDSLLVSMNNTETPVSCRSHELPCPLHLFLQKREGEGTMFNFTDSLFIASPLFSLVSLISGSDILGTVPGCEWVKNLYVKECILRPFPEAPPP